MFSVFATVIIAIFTTIFVKYYLKFKRTKCSKINPLYDKNSEREFPYDTDFMDDVKHVPLKYQKINTDLMLKKSVDFYNFMNQRRTVRMFSKEDVPVEIIRNIIKTAGSLCTNFLSRKFSNKNSKQFFY